MQCMKHAYSMTWEKDAGAPKGSLVLTSKVAWGSGEMLTLQGASALGGLFSCYAVAASGD